MATVDRNLHIEAPHLVTNRRRLSDTVLTAMMWVVYSYLWAPLISLMAWLLGFEFAYDVMVRAGGAKGLADVLIYYLIVLACICVVVSAWSGINRYRFADRERRQTATGVGDEDIAAYYSLSPDTLDKMRRAQIASVSFNSDGDVEQIRELPSPASGD